MQTTWLASLETLNLPSGGEGCDFAKYCRTYTNGSKIKQSISPGPDVEVAQLIKERTCCWVIEVGDYSY